MVDSYPNFFHTKEASSEHILENLIYSLGPSIGLRVICRTEVQTGIHGLMQSFPELQSKLGSSIEYNPLGKSMLTNYPIYIQLC
jgi:hypothetical protein